MISKDNYVKLDVEGLLDLEKLSVEYNIPKDELIQFHNNNCGISELLPLNMTKYVPFIYIPKINFESKKSRLIPNTTLKYPLNKSEKNYGVIIKYIHSNLQIHFEVNVKREGTLIVIDKKKTFINNSEVENMIEKLYQEAEKAIYPLKISVADNGSFSKIENNKEILERWEKEISPELKEYYVGETAEKIFKKMDSVFKDLNYLKHFFMQSVFYKIFFLPVYNSYSDFKKESSIEFYFGSLQKYISYDIQYILNREFTRGTKIALQMAGKEQNDPFFDKTEKGNVEMMFKFQKDTHELFSVTGFARTYDGGKELKIEFQLFDITDLN